MVTSLPEIGLALLAGSLSILSPCTFPLLPVVLGGALQNNRWAPVAMGTGMVVAFALLGLVMGLAGDALDLDPEQFRMVGATLLVAFGAAMLVPGLNRLFSQWVSPLATSAHSASSRLDPGSLTGAFAIGSLLGIVWSPCSGPLLASAVAMVATEGGALRGTLILGLFGLGAASVLVTVAYLSRASFLRARGWVVVHMDTIRKAFGLLVLFVGLAILTGADRWLEAQFMRWLPLSWIHLTTRF